MTVSQHTLEIFYCYARADKALCDELHIHLSWLRRQYQLTVWYDREIPPGAEWEHEIEQHLTTADIILLLVSPHFLASDYCYGKEMMRALERHKAGTAHVLPIVVRPTYWDSAPFSQLQMLPTDALPISRWRDRDEAFRNVVDGVRKVIDGLLLKKKKEEWYREGIALRDQKLYEEALKAFEEAIRLNPNDVSVYCDRLIFSECLIDMKM